MDTFQAEILKEMVVAGVTLIPGQTVKLTVSEYDEAFYVEVDGVKLDGLITNYYGVVFRLVAEQKRVANG